LFIEPVFYDKNLYSFDIIELTTLVGNTVPFFIENTSFLKISMGYEISDLLAQIFSYKNIKILLEKYKFLFT